MKSKLIFHHIFLILIKNNLTVPNYPPIGNWKKSRFLLKISKKSIRPIAKFFFIFFLESAFKNKLKSKISEF
jgi:hypothetical protein